MNNQVIKNFVEDFSLLKNNGIIAFNALITYFQNNLLHTITSEVQIIVWPNVAAVYIYEFIKNDYEIADMYSTANFQFEYNKNNTLEIKDSETADAFFISILPMQSS
jgi:hypothetical protein